MSQEDVQTWNNLGALLRSIGRFTAAEICYRRALNLQADNPFTLTNLGNVLKDLDRFDDALQCHKLAVKINPRNAIIQQNLGIVLRHLGKRGEALEVFERAYQLEPGHSEICWDLAIERLLHGDLKQGWTLYESRWKLPDKAMRNFNKPLWNGKEFKRKKLLIHTEQGFGDFIWAMRFLPYVKALGGEVVLECKPELRRLLNNLDGVDKIVTIHDPVPEYDLHCPIMSVAGLIGINDTTNCVSPPTLIPPQDSIKRFKNIFKNFDNKLKVGIVWSGSVTFADNRRRSAALEHFLSLAVIPKVALFSLQKGPPREALYTQGSQALVLDLDPLINDFADTAAAIDQLDVIIMTDSSVAHLAGTLGKPVWNLLSYNAYWLYGLDSNHCPWYPSMRLWRQEEPGNWEGLFKIVVNELASL
jgi:hypothetical protein